MSYLHRKNQEKEKNMAKEINYSDSFLAEKVPFVLDKQLPWSKELEVRLDNLPVSAMDSPPFIKTFLLIVTGLVLFAAGIMVVYGFTEAADFMESTASSTSSAPLAEPLQASFLGWLMIIFGAIIFAYNFFYLSLRKSYVIGFRYITLNIRNLWRQKTFMDAVANYKALRYRVFITKDNKPLYVIDAWHEEEIKSVPLYISENGFGICKRISEYAKKLNLPVYFAADNETDTHSLTEDKAEHTLPELSFPATFTSRLVHFPWHIFWGSLTFFVLLDLIIFTSDWADIMSVPVLFGWLFISSLLVFLFPLVWNYRRQEISFTSSEVIVEDLLLNFISLYKHEIKNKDIVSADLSSFKKDRQGLIINSCNEAVVVGYGAPLARLQALKATLEERIIPRD